MSINRKSHLETRAEQLEIDTRLSKILNDWRLKLAKNIYEENKNKEIQYNGIKIKLVFSSEKEIERSLKFIKENIQLILDKLIIIRYAEDKFIIDPDQLKTLNDVWKQNKSFESLFKMLCKFFLKFNNIYDIQIFKNGNFCEKIEIGNELLSNIIDESYKLCFREFNSDILGNSYENYLRHELILENNEIRLKLSANLLKAGGIYYTPHCIVNFIVQNSVGLKLDKIFKNIKELLDAGNIFEINKKIEEISTIKILDPACGSGFFLIHAYNLINDYYTKIYNLILEANREFTKKNFQKQEIESYCKSFLENIRIFEKKNLNDNIFGVDVDLQAVEIASVNLVLESLLAQKRREKLPPILYNNIKIGNSLISGDETNLRPLYGNDWKDTAPFIWKNEFSSILNNDKFTFIIGNPPYIAWNEISKREIFETGKFLDLEYDCRPNHEDSQPNLYLFFLIRALNLIKNGKIGFIIPQEWRIENYAKKFRNYLLNKSNNIQIIRFNPDFKVFKSASGSVGTNSLVIFLELTEEKNTDKILTEYYIEELDEEKVISYLENFDILEKNSIKTIKNFRDLLDKPWIFQPAKEEKLKNKINDLKNITFFTDLKFFEIGGGFQPPVETIKNFEITEDIFLALNDNEKQYVFPAIYEASEIARYYIDRQGLYWIVLNDVKTEMDLKNNTPNLYKILLERLDKKSPNWWQFPNIRNLNTIKGSNIKIISPRTANENSFCIDDRKSVFKGTNSMIISLKLDPRYVIGILNSSLGNFWYSKFGYDYHSEKTKKYEPDKIRNYSIPIVKPPNEEIERELISLVNDIIYIIKNKLNILKEFNHSISNYPQYRKSNCNLGFYLDNSSESKFNYEIFNEFNKKEGKILQLKVIENNNKIIVTGDYEDRSSQIFKNQILLELAFERTELKDFLFFSIYNFIKSKIIKNKKKMSKGKLLNFIRAIEIPKYSTNIDANLDTIYTIMKKFKNQIQDFWWNGPARIQKFKNFIELTQELNIKDNKIDEIISNLYNLTPDEINLVKKNLST